MANGNGVSLKALKFWGSVVAVAAAASMAWSVNVYRLGVMETAVSKQGERLQSMDVRQSVMETQIKAIHDAVAKPK